MKKVFILLSLLAMTITGMADPVISFDKNEWDWGEFSEDNPIQKCVFTFTNTGDAPLIINQAVASCGCTVPKFTKTPVRPGETGTINVTYSGKGKVPGHFRKSITVHSNGKPAIVRLYIEGVMTEAKVVKKK
ncbi:MAG: DUF1573 domain-containing protein [Prevotella sp.]|jgi:hypothetical protein|nr:DUF1573 domain-containing protein [Prevotella sp.]